MKRTLARIAALATLVVSPLALAAPAHALTPGDQAADACGPGYHVQDSHDMGGANPVVAFLLYNNSSGYNCAVTVKSTANDYYGLATGLGAGIIKSGGSWSKDDKSYKYYAGPVYVHAPGSCVQFWAHATDITTTNVRELYYTSPWEFCG